MRLSKPWMARTPYPNLQGQGLGLFLTDINMPNMDGLEFTRRLQAMPEYKFVPIVPLTTESHPEKKQEGKAAGATCLDCKTVQPAAAPGGGEEGDALMPDKGTGSLTGR